MKPPRKKQSLFSLFRKTEKDLRDFFIVQPVRLVRDAREKMRDLPRTNFELGARFVEQQKWWDALFRFKVTLWMQPDYPQARYNLGCCYFLLGKQQQARKQLKQVLRETPGHQEAIFMLAAVDPSALSAEQQPTIMPRAMVENFFGSIAVDYNQAEAQNQYRGGVAVAEVVKSLLPASGAVIVDLGCGTGIAAIPYHSLASRMVGVELTPAMAAQARQLAQSGKNIFAEVTEADITVPITTIPPISADLVLLVNVVQFVGKLDPVIMNAHSMLKSGGHLALTVEPYGPTEGYGLTDTGRFGHSAAYVQQVLTALGFSLVKQTDAKLYPDSEATLFVWKKG